MDITFFIGNGFDRSIGLKSDYKSFYEWYLKQPSEPPSIDKFKKIINIKKEDPLWADFEYALGQITKEYTVEEAEELADAYEDANEKLADYLALQERNYNVNGATPAAISSLHNSIYSFYKYLPPNQYDIIENIMAGHKQEDRRYNFVSFNYTRLLDLCLKRAKALGAMVHYLNYTSSIEQVIHLHGYTDLWPILGVGDISLIAKPEVFYASERLLSMLKSNAINETGQPWSKDVEKLINKSSIICIYGMSIGESDCDCWIKLSDWLKKSEQNKLVILWYPTSKMRKINVSQKRIMENDIKSKILKYSKLNKEIVEKLGKQIYVSEPGNFLNITLPQKETVTV